MVTSFPESYRLDRIVMTLRDDTVPIRWIILHQGVANLPFLKRCEVLLKPRRNGGMGEWGELSG